MVVMYNAAGKVRGVETKISSLFERADYSSLTPIRPDGRPVELLQAECSIAIAQAAGAEALVPNCLNAAQAKLVAARTVWGSNKNRDRDSAAGIAREAVIAGEDGPSKPRREPRPTKPTRARMPVRGPSYEPPQRRAADT